MGTYARTGAGLAALCIAAFSALLAASQRPPAAPTEKPAAVTCRVRDDARRRVFALREAAPPHGGTPAWQLSMQDRDTKGAWIDLALPAAHPTFTTTTAALAYRNANGGRHVDLDVSPTRSRLDVWVDYGLEVNIEPDLDPRVDRLNTEADLTALDCTLAPPLD